MELAAHPVLTCAEARAWEAGLLKSEAAEWAAMQRAGAALAAAIVEDFREIGGLPDDARILVLLGKGHNGGDALLAATALLKHRPRTRVTIHPVFSTGSPRPLTQRAWQEFVLVAGNREEPFDWKSAQANSYDLCLDGVFGMQFHPPLEEPAAKLLAWVNTHPRIRLRAAVDLPSGVGEENAGTVFRADFTYATGMVKAPMVAASNAIYTGRLRYLDLGFFSGVAGAVDPGPSVAKVIDHRPGAATPATSRVLLSSSLAPLARLRPAQTDKRTYGHLFVVGGSRQYPGAVLMTVQAALRSGVGLLTAFVPASLVPEYAAKLPEAMWVGWPETPTGGPTAKGVTLLLEKLQRATALVIGPGLGAAPETVSVVQAIVRNTNIPFLLDADALRPEVLVAAQGKRFICTPHAGEWQRIAGGLQPDENCVVVRKGSPTRLHAGGMVYHSFFGGPVLARGGSGDLLAGLIGGLLAQAPDDLLLAAGRGVVWHGLAADLLARDKGQVAVQTTQLLDYLQPALTLAAHDSP